MRDDLGGGSLTSIITFNHGDEPGSADCDGSYKTEREFSLDEFADRSTTELRRLGFLLARGVPLTVSALSKIDIKPPADSESVSSATIEREHAEEMKSLSDGHIVLSSDMISSGNSPPIDPRRSLTRIGIGTNNANRATDTRPPVLRRAAGPLRIEMAKDLDELANSPRLLARQYAPRQPLDACTGPAEQAAILYAASSGIFDRNAFESKEEHESSVEFLAGGASSPLIQALKAQKPYVLDSIRDSEDINPVRDGRDILGYSAAAGVVRLSLRSCFLVVIVLV